MSSGLGPDGGVDMIAHIFLHDGTQIVKRAYIIQCKFHESNISPDHLGRSSITDLITSKGADAYLLICKKNPTNKLKEYFEDLTRNCRNKYAYLVWSREEFLEKLYEAPDSLIKQFFDTGNYSALLIVKFPNGITLFFASYMLTVPFIWLFSGTPWKT